jgi:hypothetical protein
VDILAKIQSPPSNDPNVRNAHVGSFFAIAKLNLPLIRFAVHSLECPPDIHPAESFAHAKTSNATAKPQISLFRMAKIIDNILVSNWA